MVMYDFKEKKIIGNIVMCRACLRVFKDGDKAYYAQFIDGRRFVYCRDCLLEGVVMEQDAKVTSATDRMLGKHPYRWGIVSLVDE